MSEEPQSHDRFDAKSTPTKKLAETSKNLSRFSRGNVPEAQKDTFDPRKYFYSYDFDKPNEPAVNGSPRAGGFGGEAGKIAGAQARCKRQRSLARQKANQLQKFAEPAASKPGASTTAKQASPLRRD